MGRYCSRKKAAEQLINQGVDAIVGIGDACDAGVIQAVDEAAVAGKEVWFIGAGQVIFILSLKKALLQHLEYKMCRQ
ncbi:hypothetical protein [endosymbiont 'TC1' of Trimyema compressum]|uniref:hypothetical protein n=1 Tax=endosymbiont 'TC1' of Trimyema compressum TaxID=243899 RepID=UPI00155DF4BB|nr:hypothetical protein [endosymbiont 'TC1' of Trimyema compressum]